MVTVDTLHTEPSMSLSQALRKAANSPNVTFGTVPCYSRMRFYPHQVLTIPACRSHKRTPGATPIGEECSTERRIWFCRQLQPHLLNVFGNGRGRRQEVSRKLESRRWGDPRLCASLSSTNSVLHKDSLVSIDWFILRCRRLVDLCVDSVHSTEPTGHL